MALAIALRSSRPFQFFFSTRHRSYVRSVYARRRLRVHPCLLTIQHGRTFFHLVVFFLLFFVFSFSFFFFLFPSFPQAQRHGDRIRQNCHFNAFQVIAPVTVRRIRLSFKRKNVTRVIAFAYCAFHPLAPHRKLIALHKSTPRLAAFPSPLTVVSSMFDRYGPYASLFAYSAIHIISFFHFLSHCFVQPQKLHGKQSRIARLSLVIFRSRRTHTSHR